MGIDNQQNTGTSNFFNWDNSSGVTRAGADKYPNPFCDIASEYVPRDINAIFEWCGVKGTWVELDRYGRLAEVQDLKLGDSVLSADSTINPVERTSNRVFTGEAITIKASGLVGLDVTVTPEHPFFVSETPSATGLKYIPAGELTEGLWAVSVLPKYREGNGMELSPYLCGAYLAEGNIIHDKSKSKFNRNRARFKGLIFSVGSHEKEFIERICNELFKVTGKKARVYIPPRVPTSCVISIHDARLASYMATNFGYTSEAKILPAHLFHATEAEKEEFLAGWFDGDGAVVWGADRVTPQLSGYTVNRQLAWQLSKLMFSCGIHPTLMRRVRPNVERTGYGKDTVEHRLTLPASQGWRVCRHMVKCKDKPVEKGNSYRAGIVVQDGFIFRKIQAVERTAIDEPVYNIEVANTHNYTCNGIVSHNCEYLMLSVVPFRTVAQRVVRYFLTELVLEGQSDDEREKYEDFLNDQLHILQQLAEIGDDFMTYGNTFISIFFPFDRYLICPHCHTNYHVNTLNYRFDRSRGSFKGRCEKCDDNDVEFKREDRRSPDTTRVRVIRWNPKRMRLRVHPISGKIEYYMQMDADFVRKVLEGIPFYLNETPWAMVQACLKTDKQRKQYYFKFKDEAIYHLRSGSLAGLPVRGWGIPPILPNFKLAYYVQLLRRYDEAIALDFIIPFRVLFPKNAGPNGQDALSTLSMGTFASAMTAMVQNKRKNITDVQIAPFEIGYELLGGEAKSLAPKDNIALAMDELLNSMGFAAELYKGTLSIQAFPVALRLFEKQWNSLVDGFNDLISWMLKRLGRHFMWGEVTGTLRSVTLADDIERKALSLQAAAGKDISKATAYRPLGIDYLEEQKRIAEETETIQRLQQEAQERAQAQAQQGGGEGGQQQQAGGTPGDVEAQAQALAQQLLTQVPETQRRGELIKIKRSNPTLHALVIAAMNEMRQQMASQGQAQIMEQMKQGSVIKMGSVNMPADQLPSPVRLGLLVSSELCEYGKDDLRKIAVDIGRGVQGADKAFHYVFTRMMGWEE